MLWSSLSSQEIPNKSFKVTEDLPLQLASAAEHSQETKTWFLYFSNQHNITEADDNFKFHPQVSKHCIKVKFLACSICGDRSPQQKVASNVSDNNCHPQFLYTALSSFRKPQKQQQQQEKKAKKKTKKKKQWPNFQYNPGELLFWSVSVSVIMFLKVESFYSNRKTKMIVVLF